MNAEINAVQAYQITGRVQAFTDDPTTRDVLSRLMDGGLLQPSEVMPGGVAEALEQIQFDADAIIVDVTTSTDPVGDIADLVQRSGKQVVAIGSQNDVALYRSVLAAGAVDYLVQPITDELLVDALSRGPSHVGGEEMEPEGCRTTVITGVRGGIGASTVAVSTAWTLAEEFGLQTALVDLDLNFGTCALALDLLPGRGLREAIEHPERIDSLFVGSAMISATDRLFVLGGEEPLDRELYASSAAIHQLLAAIQPNFNAMIVDLPRSMITTQQDLLADAATIVLVTDLSIGGLRDTLRLKTLMKDNARQATLNIVAVEPANRKPPMTRKEFEKGIDGKIDILLPYDPKITAAASNQGKAIPALAGKRHPLVKSLRQVANACGEPRDKGKKRSEEGVVALLGGRSRGNETEAAPPSGNNTVSLVAQIKPIIHSDVDPAMVESLKRGDLAGRVKSLVGDYLRNEGIKLNMLEERNLVTVLVNELLDKATGAQAPVQTADAGGGRNGARSEPAPAPAPPAQVNGHAQAAPTPVAQAAPCPPQTPNGSGRVSISANGIDTAPNGASAVNGTEPAADEPSTATSRDSIDRALVRVRLVLMDRIDVAAAAKLSRSVLADEVAEICQEILREEKLHLNSLEQRDLVTILVNDMLGLGPLEPLLADDAVTDILVNGPKQTYVERKGKLELTDVTFRDNAHVMQICTRIVSAIGRRVDESSPLCDARLADGSRVNIAIPPLALDGPSISIRKFAKQKITLDKMVSQGNISAAMATVLQIAGRARLNILISGGTGSGKTTLLNAMSRQIDTAERIVTIEDAAELQLQQPHVVRMETRPANLEGEGEVTMRDLVKNSLRMRPDRIILGEVRSSEAVDMLQAMNTGHEGSMCTIHANNPREALTRLENMIGMAGINLPSKAVRTQIASAVDMIIQVSRMRDGMRRITHVAEVVGMEGDIITTQELFTYKFEGEDNNGMLVGRFEPSGLRPHFSEKAAYFGLDRPLMEAVG